MAELKLLVNSRKFVRKSVTESYNNRRLISILDTADKYALKSKLTDYRDRLNELDLKIQNIKWSSNENEEELEEELSTSEDYQNKIRNCLSQLEQVQQNLSPVSQTPPRLKCPTAPLPHYSGQEGEDLTKFFSEFEAIISKYSYADYEKLLLLKKQVSGRALILINSLESHNQGYDKAKALLEKALASPQVQIFNTIKQLSELKLDLCDDTFEYISKIKGIRDNVNKLKISVDSFLQYFVWSGLTEAFKNVLINMTNHTWPSLDEICDNYFTACERYVHHKKKKKDSGQSTDMAVNINIQKEGSGAVAAKFFPCSLCSTDKVKANHNIRECTKFSSPASKVEQLKKVNGCVRCGFSTHSTKNCKYRFRDRCNNCNEFHWNYLCTNSKEKLNATGKLQSQVNQSSGPKGSNTDDKGSKTENKKGPSKAQGGQEKSHGNIITVTEALNSSSEGETILPTFTCNVKGQLVRGMKDSGCQTNFVTQKLAESLNLPVIQEHIKLTVNGINVPKDYDTKIVELEMNLGESTKVINALCIPDININLKLPCLRKIVDGFLSKGYKMADRKLLHCEDEISDIQIILGSKSGYCVPETEITFGMQNKSLYSETPCGVMLKGDVKMLLIDLPYLSYAAHISGNACVSTTDETLSHPRAEKLKFCLSSNVNFGEPCNDDNFTVLDDAGEVVEVRLFEATNDILESVCEKALHKDTSVYTDESVEIHDKLIDYALEKTKRNNDGRLIMPLLWNPRVSHLLGQNFGLSKQILMCLLKKYHGKDEDRLKQLNKVFKDQEEAGIIKRVDNLEQLLQEHPEASFLPYMGIFKPERETTKCRVVFLSNLCENKSGAMSHNQTMHAGPPLNQKLSSSLIHLRFGNFLCCFDIKKAFNQIGLEEVDQNRLLFLWFRNIDKEDFSFVAYRNCRLPFGLRCSPTILMLGLYKILVMDSKGDSLPLRNLKRLIYQLSYMDNCAFTAETSECLLWMYKQLNDIFSPYKLELQQFLSNDLSLQRMIDTNEGNEITSKSKLLGLQWDQMNDTLSTKCINLDVNASTKRQVLSTIAAQFDLLNFNGPLMNRSKLFLHRLQCQKQLEWDEKLSADQTSEWRNIAKQANSAPPIEFPRNFGSRNNHYKLIGFADSSKAIFGTVIYIQNLETNKLIFILARNKLVNKQLESKSIPSLELQALALAAETIEDLKKELTGPTCIDPIVIEECELYSDSLVVLSWLQSYALKLEKLQKKQPFILNRLEYINKLCESTPITFSFVSGEDNPADCITRPLSYRQLMKSSYISGPSFVTDSIPDGTLKYEPLSFTLPGPSVRENSNIAQVYSNSAFSPPGDCLEHLVPLDRCSSFHRVARIHALVLKFCNTLKLKLKAKHLDKFDHFRVEEENFNFYDKACKQIVFRDQQLCFPEVFEYFNTKHKTLKKLPNIVSQLNLYIDPDGLIRVKSKCQRMKGIQKLNKFTFPLLISRNSALSPMIIRDLHIKLSHAGCYSVLAELRKNFWITHVYSTVKKVLSDCVICKRLNERVIKLNQSPYPEFRINPDNVPYRQIFIDHMGPFKTKNEQGNTIKVWLLCITCLWSRAINLKVCMNLSTDEFLRALQLHTFEYGLPTHCFSDLGSQFVAGANSVSSFLNDHETVNYFKENGISPLKFEHYYKGHSQLGSLVESCVKLTKKLLFGAMRNNILSIRDFEFIVQKTIHLVNRRPIAFKESLRDSSGDDLPEIITPEMLVHCRELISINIIPQLQNQIDPDPDYNVDQISSSWCKLQKVRHNLIKLYNEEL